MSSAFSFDHFDEEPESQPPAPMKRRHRGWRIFGWTIAGLFCLIIATLMAVSALINSGGIHRAILNFAQKKASESLGVRVKLENFVLHWSTLSLDLYGVTADGAGPHPNPPLLQVQHLEVGVRVISVLQHKWYLDNLRIDRPVVWIYVDKNGVSNIPTFNSSNKSGGNNNTLFDLGIRHAALDGGEVYYNSKPSAMAADLHDLNLEATYNALRQMYSGSVAYRDGHLYYGAYRPIPHNLDIAFDLTPNTFELKQARLSSGDSQVLLSATVNNYQSNPAARAEYHVAIDGGQMAHLLNQPALPSGFLRAAGNIDFRSQPNRPLLQALVVNGDLTSDALALRAGTVNAEVSNLSAHYALANGNATLRDFRAAILGGTITAQGTMTDLGGNGHSNFSAAVRDVSLARVKQVLGKSAATPGVGLSGTLNATATAAWGKTMDSLVAKTDASIHADVSPQQKKSVQSTANANLLDVANTNPQIAPGGAAIPIESEIHAAYTNANGQLKLANSYLRTTQTDLTLNGTVSQHSSLAIQLQANDLRELAAIANTFSAPAPNQQPIDLAGTASFKGSVQGSVAAPHLTGELTAMNLHVNGSDWKVVRAGVDASPDHAALENADLEPATRGRITLSARTGLEKWAFSKETSLVQAEIHASQVDIQDLAKFAGQTVPVTGTLNTSVSVHGTAMNPEGSGNVSITGMTAYQQPIESVRADFTGNGQQARANLAVQLKAGSLQATVTVQPQQRTYTAQLSSSGIHLDQLEALKVRNIKAAGVLQLNAGGQGSFDNPQLNATVQAPNLTVSNQTISGLNLQLNMANHVANASLNSSVANMPIQAKATVHLTGDYQTDASLDTPVLNLQPLLALYSPDEAQSISGQAQVHATVHGPIKNMKALEAHLTIPVFNAAYQNSIQIAAAAPIQVNYQNGVIDVPESAIRGTDTDIEFQGHIPTEGTQPMSIKVSGAVDMKLAQIFDPGVRSSGQIKLNIDSHGLLSRGGDIGGEIDIVNANFAEADMPVGLENGNGVLKLTADRVNIASFEGTVGGGKVELQGGVTYRPNLVFDLGLTANGVRMLYPEGMRESVNANLRLGGTTAQAFLGGAVDLANLSFTPAFDLSSFAGQFSGGVAAPPSQGLAQNIQLNLAVHSDNNLNLVSRELSINGSANLQVRGTAAEPVILGRVNLTGGDIILNGNRFVLTGGTVQFINPSETEPVLNMTITTTIQEYNISLRFQGPVDQMRSDYSSNPSLPTADIIHLLAFGSTTEAAANNATPANQEAESLVASQVSSQVTSRISKVAGISQLSVSPVLQGGTQQGPPGANITIRQRVTGNLFITFSTNVATTQDQVIQGQYQVSPRLAVSATRDPNGGFGFDALIKNSW